MPPIPIHAQSPINPAKASGVTPQTEAPDQSPATASVTTTPPSKTASGYAAAQPGASPSQPQPTGCIQTQLHSPLRPTPTINFENQGPPPPQPGAVPSPTAGRTAGRTMGVGGMYQSPASSTPVPSPAVVPTPPQLFYAAPSMQYAPRGTSTAACPSPAHASVPSGQLPDLSHPPGYQQDANASDFRHRQAANDPFIGDHGGRGGGGPGDIDEEGMWTSAVKWAQTAGQKLSEAESEVWRRINKG